MMKLTIWILLATIVVVVCAGYLMGWWETAQKEEVSSPFATQQQTTVPVDALTIMFSEEFPPPEAEIKMLPARGVILYFLNCNNSLGEFKAIGREAQTELFGDELIKTTLKELVAGPTKKEIEEEGLWTEIPEEIQLVDCRQLDNPRRVYLVFDLKLSELAEEQIRLTMKDMGFQETHIYLQGSDVSGVW